MIRLGEHIELRIRSVTVIKQSARVQVRSWGWRIGANRGLSEISGTAYMNV